MKKKKKKVVVSGGFDPVHIGHIRYFEAARKLGDHLTVILNNDNWLRDKKGNEFMKEGERKEIILALSAVDEVFITDHKKGEYHKDKSVVRALKKIRPDIFANGGDRKPEGDPVPEVALCAELGIKMIYNVGGEKANSSSTLLNNYTKKKSTQS